MFSKNQPFLVTIIYFSFSFLFLLGLREIETGGEIVEEKDRQLQICFTYFTACEVSFMQMGVVA